MTNKFDYIIENGEIFLDNKIQKINIGLKNGKIEKIFNDSKKYNAKKTINAKNKWVLPGVIDIHFHIRAPAFPKRGTVRSETKAAAKGGVTTFFEMPISDPCASTPEIIRKRKEHFLKNSYVNFGLIAAIGQLNEKNLNGLIKEGVIAFKIFTIAPPPNRFSEFDGLCFVTEGELFEALSHAKKSNLVTIFHAESQELLDHFKDIENKFDSSDPKQHNALRPPMTEVIAIAKILTINSYIGAKIHIAHVTSKISCDLISFFQKQGQDLTAETCPHYLFKTEDDVLKHHAFGKINPPIRNKKEQKELWQAIEKNIITIVASDHAAFSYDEKIKGKDKFSKAPPGTPGGELLFPLMINAAINDKIELKKVIKLLCENPAKRFGLYPEKGIIKEGSDADIIIFDPKKIWKITKDHLQTKGKSCAHLYYGDSIKGKINITIVGGKIIYENGKFIKTKNFKNYIKNEKIKTLEKNGG
jgi:dihydroorotase (multifunctional complex type)